MIIPANEMAFIRFHFKFDNFITNDKNSLFFFSSESESILSIVCTLIVSIWNGKTAHANKHWFRQQDESENSKHKETGIFVGSAQWTNRRRFVSMRKTVVFNVVDTRKD